MTTKDKDNVNFHTHIKNTFHAKQQKVLWVPFTKNAKNNIYIKRYVICHYVIFVAYLSEVVCLYFFHNNKINNSLLKS
jgi:hypothetical protein